VLYNLDTTVCTAHPCCTAVHKSRLVSLKIVRHGTVCCVELIQIVRYPLCPNTLGVLVTDRNRHGESVCVRHGRHSVYVQHGVCVFLTHRGRGRGRGDEERRGEREE
jgi:hypothetical protein